MSVVYHKLGDERGVLEGMGRAMESQLGSNLEEGHTLHSDLQSKYNTSSNEKQQQQWEGGAAGLNQPTYLNDPANTEPLYGNI